MIYNQNKYVKLINDPSVDAIIFTFRHHVSSQNNQYMYGWVKTEGDRALEVSVKIPISGDPYNDHAIVGAFYFKKVEFFKKALNSLLSKKIKVNGEYYVDSLMGELITMGYNVKIFEVDHYICWGTPDDYKTFIYWQSFFHKCTWHPYSLYIDPTVNKNKIDELDKRYRQFEQKYK